MIRFALLFLVACAAGDKAPDTDGDDTLPDDTDPAAETDTASEPVTRPAGLFADTDPDDWRVVVIGNFPNELTDGSCGLGDDVCYDCFYEATNTYARWYRQEVPDGGYLWFEDVVATLVFTEWNPSDGTGILADGTGFQAIRGTCVPMYWRYHD